MMLGNDLAVLRLKEAVEGVTPIAVAAAAFTASDVGRAFAVVGFGSKTTYSDKRSAGRVTIRAVDEHSYEALFGSWRDNANIALDTAGWNNAVILPGYEIHAGGQPGDDQPCVGDEGAPLLGREDGTKKVFGVASTSLYSSTSACDFGTFFATIGPKTREMIEAASLSVPAAVEQRQTGRPTKITADDVRSQIDAYRSRVKKPLRH